MQKIVNALLALLVLVALALVLVFLQSYTGRQGVVESQRQACLGFDRTVLVPLLNVLRADEEGNMAIASDPKQSVATRTARTREALLESSALTYMDLRIDPRFAGQLNPVGRQIVLDYQRRGIAFSCERAYPSASPVKFF